MKLFKIIFFLIIAQSMNLFGQIGISVDATSGYASNIFGNYSQLPDYYQYLQGYLNYDVVSEKQGFRTYYQGSATLFEKYDYRSYSLHKAGISYFANLNERANKVNAGLNINMRLHSDDYKWYEYKQGYAFTNIKIAIRPQLYGYFGTNFRLREYENLNPYSYWQNVSFIRMSKSFNSGTSLIAEFDFMQKVYLHNDEEPIDTFSDLETNGDGQSRQIVALLRAGQAISPKTGLSLQFLVRRNLKSSVRYLINDEGYYYSDEELFDDPFGYNGEQLNLTLKQKLPWKIQASIGATYLMKHYSNRMALDMEGYPFDDFRLRDDTRLLGWLNIAKSWKYSRAMAPITFNIDVSLLKNNSNDPYYNYHTSYYSIGLSQSF